MKGHFTMLSMEEQCCRSKAEASQEQMPSTDAKQE